MRLSKGMFQNSFLAILCPAYLVLILGHVQSPALGAQSLALGLRDSIPHRKLSPAQFIRASVIQDLEDDLRQSSPPYRQILRDGSQELERYYKELYREEQILKQVHGEPSKQKRYDENILRLLNLAQKSSFVRPYLLRQSPYLFRLHIILAKSYSALAYQHKALSHYAQAFRYVKLEPLALEKARQLQDILSKDPIPKSSYHRAAIVAKKETKLAVKFGYDGLLSQKKKDERYLWMNDTFASKQRLTEEKDTGFRAAGMRFRSVFKEYSQWQQKYTQILKQLENLGDDDLEDDKKSLWTKEKLRIETRLRKARVTLESLRKGAYQRYLRRHRKISGDAAFEMALEMRWIEIKKSQKRAPSDKKGTASFTERISKEALLDRSATGDLKGLRAVLQLVHKIDPFRLDAVRSLSEQFFFIRDIRQATHFTRLYLQLAQMRQPTPKKKQDIIKHVQRLAALYVEQNKNLEATGSYEFLLRLPLKSQQRLVFVKQLADLHYRHTGHLERAKELYQEYLASTVKPSKLTLTDPKQEKPHTLHRLRYQSFINLSAISRKQEKQVQEQEYLQQAREIYIDLEQSVVKKRAKIQDLQSRILRLKQQLQEGTLPVALDASSPYRLAQADLRQEQNALQNLKVQLVALSYPTLLQRLAWLAHGQGRWEEAEELYNELIPRSTGAIRRHARKYLEEIQSRP